MPADEPLPGLVRLDLDWLRQIRYRWEAINNAWDQWVLGYNTQRQQEVLTRLGFRDPDWQAMTAAFAILCGLALLAVVLWTLRQRRPTPPEQRLWQRYCRRLQTLGVERAAWEGPLALAERAERHDTSLGALTRQAAECYAQLHYGVGGREHLETLKHCLRQLERWPMNTRSHPS